MTAQEYAHENKLSLETSPYLIQHKNNPVDWYAWGDEALKLAKSTQKPILLSIGYASCHWCHVMAHESFEDDETAHLMNEFFINIKVDREERPDIDEIYLEAVQIMTGHGGWPLTVFLTPDLKPFFGGTYFPLQAKYGQPSFKDVLTSIANFYKENKSEVLAKSEQITNYLNAISAESSLKKYEEVFKNNKLNFDFISENLLNSYDELLNILEREMDQLNGGFGRSPKFPQPSKLSAFLFSENKKYIAHAIFSLRKICCGGIMDQIGGGLSRYSVDASWTVPHFEKMLYDNAQIIPLLSAASLITQENNPALSEQLKSYAYNIYHYLERDLKCKNLSIYFSSEDADSEGEEGLFYTFTYEEFCEVLSDNQKAFNISEKFYNVTKHGNFEGTNILTAPEDLELFFQKMNIDLESGKKIIEGVREKIFNYRNKRVRPGLDNKCILGWNALLSTGLLQSAVFLQDRSLFKNGLCLLKNLLNIFKKENDIYHVAAKNNIKIDAFVDDVAFLLEACCEALMLTGCKDLWKEINILNNYIYNNFYDKEEGIIYYSKKDKDLINRPVKNEDNVIYSANSAILSVYFKINSLIDKDKQNSFFTKKDLDLLKEISFVSLANSASLAHKMPVYSAQVLQKIKWLEKEKFLYINSMGAPTDFFKISQIIQEYMKKQKGYIFLGCSLNEKFSLNQLENYSEEMSSATPEYLYCDRTGCRLAVKNISELFH